MPWSLWADPFTWFSLLKIGVLSSRPAVSEELVLVGMVSYWAGSRGEETVPFVWAGRRQQLSRNDVEVGQKFPSL